MKVKRTTVDLSGYPDMVVIYLGMRVNSLHALMRQCWRDFEALETWARSTMPHQKWWKDFLRDPGGTGFWHETYFRRGPHRWG